jgi:hypothetical protein
MFMLVVKVQVATVRMLQFLVGSMAGEMLTTAMQLEERQVVVVHLISGSVEIP